MMPPIFEVVSADSGVSALLGSGAAMRFYSFGRGATNTKPYAVWQTVYGSPENYLGEVPDMDSFGLQIDVYAATAQSAKAVAKAIRDAIEPHAHVVAWRGESRDPETNDYRFSFDVDWLTPR